MNLTLRLIVMLALLATSAGARCQTLRVANQGDAMSMDPHTHNEGVQLSLLGNLYEPLVTRGPDLRLAPALATAWNRSSPTVWTFDLRKGVRFHDGSPFTADDVVFSLRRAMQVAELRIYLGDVRDVRALGPYQVELVTQAASPALAHALTMVYMMSRAWCEAVGAVQPADRVRGLENAASFRANGTGPFRLRERQPDVRTTMVRNRAYWGGVAGNVQEVVWMPIGHPATRVAALLSGEVDLIDPVPVQDMEMVNASGRASVLVGPELRILFLGMDQRSPELPGRAAPIGNPLKDLRVRQAIYQAIDIGAIHRTVMRGASTPTALMISPGVTGYDAAQDKRLPYDPVAARRLLGEAGYPDGFELPMNCPNDRYVGDEGICRAVAAALARVGIQVRLVIEPKATYFRKVMARESPFYLLGWAPATFDALNVLQAVMVCPDGKGQGYFNAGGYCSARVDELVRAAQSEQRPAQREALLREALAQHTADIGHVPLHRQALAWGVRRGVQAVQRADNMMNFAGFTVTQHAAAQRGVP